MPKQKRWAIKRELDQANGHIDLAINQLAKTGNQYEGIHDDYYAAFCSLITLLTMSQGELKSLKDKI